MLVFKESLSFLSFLKLRTSLEKWYPSMYSSPSPSIINSVHLVLICTPLSPIVLSKFQFALFSLKILEQFQTYIINGEDSTEKYHKIHPVFPIIDVTLGLINYN